MKGYHILFSCVILATTAMAGDDFLAQLTPADFTAAGLHKQTPEELAWLTALVRQFKSGELAEMRRAAATQTQLVQQAAEQKIMAAETKAREAVSQAEAAVQAAQETRATIASNSAKRQPGWLAALTTLARATEKSEKEEPLESSLIGDFNGWNGSTTFTLEDGSQWRQQNKVDRYSYSPPLHVPKVKISPATNSSFWLEVSGVNTRVRVIPLTLPK